MNTIHLSLRYVATAIFYVILAGAGTSLFAQVKIGSNPATIGSNSNLEVEAANGKKVIVHADNGTVVIENTPSGAVTDSLLTVDQSGNVRAISPDRIEKEQPAASMERISNQALPGGSQSVVDFTNVVDNDLGSVDLANDEIVIKEAGIYTFSSTIEVLIPGSTGRANVDVFIQKFNGSAWDFVAASQSEQNATQPLTLSVSTTAKFMVGDRLRVVAWPCNTCLPGNPAFTLTRASFFAGRH